MTHLSLMAGIIAFACTILGYLLGLSVGQRQGIETSVKQWNLDCQRRHDESREAIDLANKMLAAFVHGLERKKCEGHHKEDK